MAAGDVITIIEDNAARKGVYFDGTDDYILIDAHAVERVAANDTTGTYALWVYVNAIGANQTVLSAGDNDSANEFLEIRISTLGALVFKLQQGGATQALIGETNPSIVARRWTHLAIVHNGTRPIFYVNGLAVAMTDSTATDLTMWYDELANVDKFALGVLESNGAHTQDFTGAIGQVRYWSRALSATEIAKIYNGESVSTAELPDSTYLRLNLSMEDDGTTDSGVGADNGTLTGNAHYGGYISAHSRALEANTSGHAAEKVQSFLISPTKTKTIIVRGD